MSLGMRVSPPRAFFHIRYLSCLLCCIIFIAAQAQREDQSSSFLWYIKLAFEDDSNFYVGGKSWDDLINFLKVVLLHFIKLNNLHCVSLYTQTLNKTRWSERRKEKNNFTLGWLPIKFASVVTDSWWLCSAEIWVWGRAVYCCSFFSGLPLAPQLQQNCNV